MERTRVGQLEVAFLDEGPRHGRPVVMQHGFPDGPWTFDHLAAEVVAAGYRVIRPWLRGYPPTDVPRGWTVGVPDLVGDLDGLAAALDLHDPVLVGHDWGAVVGWTSTAAPSTPWTAYVALAIPPGPVMARVRRHPAEAARLGYMAVLAAPGTHLLLPRLVTALYGRWMAGRPPPDGHVDRVREVLADRRAARAATAYYRGVLRDALGGRFPADPDAVPSIPVRYLHGEDDVVFTAAAALRAERHLPGGAVRLLPRCGHFLHLERPEEVAEDVLRFLDRL